MINEEYKTAMEEIAQYEDKKKKLYDCVMRTLAHLYDERINHADFIYLLSAVIHTIEDDAVRCGVLDLLDQEIEERRVKE